MEPTNTLTTLDNLDTLAQQKDRRRTEVYARQIAVDDVVVVTFDDELGHTAEFEVEAVKAGTKYVTLTNEVDATMRLPLESKVEVMRRLHTPLAIEARRARRIIENAAKARAAADRVTASLGESGNVARDAERVVTTQTAARSWARVVAGMNKAAGEGTPVLDMARRFALKGVGEMLRRPVHGSDEMTNAVRALEAEADADVTRDLCNILDLVVTVSTWEEGIDCAWL